MAAEEKSINGNTIVWNFTPFSPALYAITPSTPDWHEPAVPLWVGYRRQSDACRKKKRLWYGNRGLWLLENRHDHVEINVDARYTEFVAHSALAANPISPVWH